MKKVFFITFLISLFFLPAYTQEEEAISDDFTDIENEDDDIEIDDDFNDFDSIFDDIIGGFFVPKYLLSKESYDVSKKPDDGKITIVSANARCYTPGDLFKKSWFYRAPLLVRTLADAAPDIIGF